MLSLLFSFQGASSLHSLARHFFEMACAKCTRGIESRGAVFAYWKFVNKFPESGALPVVPLVGLRGLEPPTLRLSGVRSNHLSYKPMAFEALAFSCFLPPQPRPASRHDFFFCFLFFFHQKEKEVVEMRRIELLTPCLQGRCSPS